MKDNGKDLLKELVRLDIPREDIQAVKTAFETCPDVADTLGNPLVTNDEKHDIIKQIFPESLERFLMTAARGGHIAELSDIFEEYEDLLLEKQGSIRAVVRYVTPLTESQQADLRKFIMEKFNDEKNKSQINILEGSSSCNFNKYDNLAINNMNNNNYPLYINNSFQNINSYNNNDYDYISFFCPNFINLIASLLSMSIFIKIIN